MQSFLLQQRITQNNSKQVCIPVGCVTTAAVVATRCQYQGVLGGLPTEGLPTRSAQPSWVCLEGAVCPTPSPTGDRQTLLKT